MESGLIFWRYLERKNGEYLLGGIGNRDIHTPSVGRIMIRGGRVIMPDSFEFSYFTPLKKEGQIVLNNHYTSHKARPQMIFNEFDVSQSLLLHRVYFSGFDLDELTYPFLDVMKINPVEDRLETDKGYIILAEIREDRKLTGRADMIPVAKLRKPFTRFKSFQNWNDFLKSLSTQ